MGLNILFVRRGSVTILDGISTYILELASALEDLGHKVYILCGGREHANIKCYIREYTLVNNVPSIFNWGYVGYIPNPKAQRELLEHVRRLDVDLVHFNGFIPIFANLDIPKLMTHHGIPMSLNSLNRCFLLMGYKVLSPFAVHDLIITVSKKLKQELKNAVPFIGRRIVVIPPGINVEKIMAYAERDERDDIVVHVGTRLQKAPEISLMAFIRAVKKYKVSSKLVIVGEGDEKLKGLIAKLPAGVRSRVQLLKPLKKMSLLKLISRAKILIAPSIYEAFHILSLEAQALGTPIIASPAVPEEACIHGLTCFRVANPYNYDEFAYWMNRLLKDDDLWYKMHRNAMKFAEIYDIKRIASKIANIYRDLVEFYDSS
jgi:glycosyltransferase involved in cell wall biosynthesis